MCACVHNTRGWMNRWMRWFWRGWKQRRPKEAQICFLQCPLPWSCVGVWGKMARNCGGSMLMTTTKCSCQISVCLSIFVRHHDSLSPRSPRPRVHTPMTLAAPAGKSSMLRPVEGWTPTKADEGSANAVKIVGQQKWRATNVSCLLLPPASGNAASPTWDRSRKQSCFARVISS